MIESRITAPEDASASRYGGAGCRRAVALAVATIMLLALAMPTAHADEEAVTSATPMIVSQLRESAEKSGMQANEELQRAKQWHELADQARSYAREAREPADRKSWTASAAYYDQQAQQLEDSVAQLQASAAADSARADRLEKAVQAAMAPKPTEKAASPEPLGPTEAESLSAQAQWQQGRASDLAEVAGRWNEAARHLQAQIPTTPSAARKAALQEAADLYYAQAHHLEADAKQAGDDAERLRALASQTPADFRRPEAESLGDAAPPEAFEGRWEAEGSGGEEIIIRRQDKNANVGFTLQSRHNRWLGYYDSAPKPKNGRMWFWYDPDYLTLNREIPEWARQQVAKSLQWRFAFDTDQPCGTDHIIGNWYPGEVTWDEAARKAWVTGQGEPIAINFNRVVEPEEEIAGAASIYPVTAARIGAEYQPLRSVSRGMPFRLKAVLPSKLGAAAGSEIFALMKGGDGEFSVTLRGSPLAAGPWIYISSPIQFERYRGIDERVIQGLIETMMSATKGGGGGVSFGALSREADSHSATFKTADGEVISIAYGEANSQLAVFDGLPSFGVFQVRRALNDQEIALRTAQLLGATGISGEAIERKLAMILNARNYLNYQAAATETWPEQMNVAIGLQYLHLLKMSDDRDWGSLPAKALPNDQGVVFGSAVEKNFVEARIAEIKDRSLSDYFQDLTNRLRSGIDEKKAIDQYLPFDVEDLKITVMGEDWEGRPVDRMTRALSGTRVALQTFVAVAGVYGDAGAAKGVIGAGEREAELGAAKLSAIEGESEAALSDISPMEGPSDILEIPTREEGLFPRPVVADLEPSPAQIRESMAKKFGTKEFELLEPSQAAIDHAAAGGYCVKSGCTLASITYLLEESGIAEVTSDTLHRLLKANFGINVILQKGASLAVVRDILEGLYGAATRVGKAGLFNLTNIEKGIANGARYITSIRYATGELHAVVITGIERAGGAESAISHVRFFDVNAGTEVRMSCKVLLEKLWQPVGVEGAAGSFSPELLEVMFK